MYKQIFANLEKVIIDSSLQPSIISIERQIKSENNRDWASKTVIIGKYECLANKIVTLFEFKGEFFICIPEKELDNNVPFNSKLISNVDDNNNNNLYSENAGLVPLLWSEVKSYQKSNINQDELWNKIFGNDYIRYNLEDLQPYFIALSIWKIDKNEFQILLDYLATTANDRKKFIEDNEGLFWNTIYQFYGLFLCQQKALLNLPYSDKTINTIISLLENYGNYIGETVFQGLTSAQWRHSYLEFYRCIERLYPIKKVKALQEKIVYSGNLEELASILEDKLEYRVNESRAIKDLFEQYLKDEVTINDFAAYLEISITVIADKIYKYRNAIAHSRKIFSSQNVNTKEINDELIGHFCKIISILYNKLHTHLTI